MTTPLAKRIKARIEEIGTSARAVSLKVTGSAEFLRAVYAGAQPRADNLAKLANVLGVSIPWLLTGRDDGTGSDSTDDIVPIVGYVGAGSEAHFYDIAHDPSEFVPIPAGVSLKSNVDLKAVEIRGDSLGSIYNGWLAYYDDVHQQPDSTMLKKLCVVGLKDGRVLVKQLMKGSAPGLYHLLSQTEGVIEDAEISWAAVVRAMAQR
jgi:transcriptional regulator with XRE-family HTH domain